MYCPPKVRQKESNFWGAVHKNLDSMRFIVGRLILFENLFKPRQFHLAVDMLLTSSVLSATSKQCFELTSSVLSTTSKQCFELTSSVPSTTLKQCFEQPAANFLVCTLIFIEYYFIFS